jgi:hypothetical protein
MSMAYRARHALVHEWLSPGRRLLSAMPVVAMLVCALLSVGVANASAEETTTICVPEKPSKPVVSTNAKGECAAKSTTTYKSVTLPGTGELETLNKILPHIKYEEAGVGGKPTIQFSAVNVQVVSGSGSTSGEVNGEGNLVIGYDENTGKHAQTGSHNLILGVEQTFTSFGGLLAGELNTVSAPYASASGGSGNTASAKGASVTGGSENKATEEGASVTGGFDNTASGLEASVTGGRENSAREALDSVTGGIENRVEGGANSISGGARNTIETDTQAETIVGGEVNKVPFSSFGNVIVGGGENSFEKEAFRAAILGGHKIVINGNYTHSP